ncbi:hypothetical protein GCM10011391_37280 [Pullulanibacillus camelliae]|uniref:Uncharacterized protein n=1 Tax=Pullulanibacillus camelliae TaxID=1707096 RepID=A0A8J2YNK0_9BACL|nr:hypothetical protein [Pullulanibacillus camelliae]GGE54836.1 hypothetical protein GCM10011391_37280 [Pullulanibacillus camelliae]
MKFIEGMKNGEDKFYDMQLFTSAKKFCYIPETVYMYRTRDDNDNLSMTQQDMESTILNDCKAANLVKNLLTKDQFEMFQINAMRSILWKLIDPSFNSLPLSKKFFLLKSIRPIILSYNPELIKKYFKLEYPFISLLSKGYIDLAKEYIQIHISRKYWYLEGKSLLKIYSKQRKMLNSRSWKMTKVLRVINNKKTN